MAEILTQRALLLAELETTFGVDPVPSPSTDAFLVAEPDYSVEVTELERDFARQSLSPLPIAAGRALAKVKFKHEVRSNGIFDGVTPPRVGRLLRACGFSENAVVTNGTTNGRTTVTADAGNGGPAVTWAAGGSNAVIRAGAYRIRVVLGGASATARVRVTGGHVPEDQSSHASQERDAVRTETFCVETVLEQGTHTGAATVDDSTDPQDVEYDFSGLGGLTIGDQFRVTVLGIPFLVTLTTAATATQLAVDVAAAVDAHPDFVAVAALGVVNVTFAAGAAHTVVTSGVTAVLLRASGHTVTPTWAGSLVLNDAYSALARPTGFEYYPISTDFPSLTIYLYFDGVLHKLVASRGTFTMEAPSGQLATFSFEFTGNYVAVVDAAIPSATFETTVPHQVELSLLQVNPDIDRTEAPEGPVCDTWEDQVNGVVDTLCAANFSLDMANNIVPRECVNEPDGYNGVIITGRDPVGAFDPELELVATHDFWGNQRSAEILSGRARVGVDRGNIVRFESDSAQYAGLSYTDRDGLRALEVDLRFSGTAPAFEDSELLIAFN
jgi:hypothetical protein